VGRKRYEAPHYVVFSNPLPQYKMRDFPIYFLKPSAHHKMFERQVTEATPILYLKHNLFFVPWGSFWESCQTGRFKLNV